jgi:hypothetical protein
MQNGKKEKLINRYNVSMRVNQSQFFTDLKDPLESLGYYCGSIISFANWLVLVNNASDKPLNVSMVDESNKENNERIFIEEYNPTLFLEKCSTMWTESQKKDSLKKQKAIL